MNTMQDTDFERIMQEFAAEEGEIETDELEDEEEEA
jgi:hypothetical protein